MAATQPAESPLGYEPKRFLIGLIGRSFCQPTVLQPFLDVLYSRPNFAPESWGKEERDVRPLDELPRLADGQPKDFLACLRRRKKKHKYFAMLRPSEIGDALVELDAKPDGRKHWPDFFELGDALTDAYRPQIGWTHVVANDDFQATDPNTRARLIIDLGSSAYPMSYGKRGPGGLGMRTYLGPEFVEIIGLDLLKSCGLPLLELPWGGLRVDLVERPWEASQQALVEGWQRAMEKLRPARFFADLLPGKGIEFKRGERWPGRKPE